MLSGVSIAVDRPLVVIYFIDCWTAVEILLCVLVDDDGLLFRLAIDITLAVNLVLLANRDTMVSVVTADVINTLVAVVCTILKVVSVTMSVCICVDVNDLILVVVGKVVVAICILVAANDLTLRAVNAKILVLALFKVVLLI